MSKTTILVESTTRRRLKQLGKKGDTYDQLINELMKIKRTQDSLESRFESLQSSEPVSP